MGLTIHNAPQGKTSYADDGSDWKYLNCASRWANQFPKDAEGDDQMWETQLSYSIGADPRKPGAPLYAEVGDQEVTVPIAIQLCSVPGVVSGTVTNIWAEYANHTAAVLTMDSPGPYVSRDDEMVVYTGTLTFNLGPVARADTTGLVPLHGWTGVTIKCRTVLSNGDELGSTENTLPLFSVVDPTQPMSTIKEEGLCLLGRTTQTRAHQIPVNPQNDVVGAVLVVDRNQTLPIWIPIVEPVARPIVEQVEAYDYGEDPGLPLSAFTYFARILGNDDVTPEIPDTNLFTTPFGTSGGNFDVIDPLKISQCPSVLGLAPGKYVLSLMWQVDTDGGPFPSGRISSVTIPTGLCVQTALEVVIEVGANPQAAAPLQLLPVPSVIGMTPDAAKAMIVASGFSVGDVSLNTAPTPTWALGTVWTQNPESGNPQPLPAGAAIRIGVAAFPSPASTTPAPTPAPVPVSPTPPSGGSPVPGVIVATVPSVVGMTQAEAIAAITAANLHPNQSAGTATGVVIAQSPAPGSSVVATSNVDYVLGAAAPAPTPPPPPAKTLTLPLTITDANGVTVTVS